MGDISKNFDKSELACHCCGAYFAVQDLVDALQALRDKSGVPIHVDDACRCVKHDLEVGGDGKGEHPQGKAADIRIDGLNEQQMYVLACEIPAFDQGGVGLYDGGFIHVDVRGTRARWSRVDGKYGPIEAILNKDWSHNEA